MNQFKDSLKADVKGVFLNCDEFSDSHLVNGKEIICQVDTDVIDPKTGSVAAPFYGVFLNTVTLYVASEDMDRPVEGQLLHLDDQTFVVRQVKDEVGIFVIVMEANDS